MTKVSGLILNPSDKILLKKGDTWNETLTLRGNGTSFNPIYVGSYGSSNMPVIAPQINDSACISIKNQAGFKIEGLELCNAMTGVYMEYINNSGFDYVEIKNCYFHDLNDSYNTNPNKYNHFSSGINFSSYHKSIGDAIALTNFKVSNCTFNRCNVGFWSGHPWSKCDPSTGFLADGYSMYMSNASFSDLTAKNCKQWGYSLQWFKSALVQNCDAYNIGWGTL